MSQRFINKHDFDCTADGGRLARYRGTSRPAADVRPGRMPGRSGRDARRPLDLAHERTVQQSVIALKEVEPRVQHAQRSANKRRHGMSAAMLLTLFLTSCTLGPDYQRPLVAAPETWRAPAAQTTVDLEWWEQFQDPALRELLREALETSHDLRIAVARVDQARALAGITRADQFPTVSAGASASRNRFSDTTVPQGFGGESNRFAVAADLSFELDLWGRLRRANEAARAELLATVEARNVVQMTLVSDVATAYLRLRQLDLEL